MGFRDTRGIPTSTKACARPCSHPSREKSQELRTAQLSAEGARNPGALHFHRPRPSPSHQRPVRDAGCVGAASPALRGGLQAHVPRAIRAAAGSCLARPAITSSITSSVSKASAIGMCSEGRATTPSLPVEHLRPGPGATEVSGSDSHTGPQVGN